MEANRKTNACEFLSKVCISVIKIISTKMSYTNTQL